MPEEDNINLGVLTPKERAEHYFREAIWARLQGMEKKLDRIEAKIDRLEMKLDK